MNKEKDIELKVCKNCGYTLPCENCRSIFTTVIIL